MVDKIKKQIARLEVKLRNEEQATNIVQHIRYSKLNDSFGTEIFTEPTPEREAGC